MSLKVTIVTGGRADWGLLSPVCQALHNDPAFAVRIVATGQHLMEGEQSLKAVQDDGLEVDATVDLKLSEKDSAYDITKATARAVDGFADEFQNHRPDLLLVLGDRYEIFACVQAAFIMHIPIAHLCGGDITEGAIDDAFRHAMSKMAHLHFTTNEQATRRLCNMGENPAHIFTVGSPGLDQIHKIEHMSKEAFFETLDFTPRNQNILITFHPVTLEENSLEQCEAMLLALKDFQDTGLIITASNADPEGVQITKRLKAFAQDYEHACFHQSLGTVRYLNSLRHVDLMVGNSSSGLYEAPSFGLPAVNIGTRQKGRLKAQTVIDCAPTQPLIKAAIEKGLSQGKTENPINPYGDGHTAHKIREALKSVKIDAALLKKPFFDTVPPC